jgi:hypothetical protein
MRGEIEPAIATQIEPAVDLPRHVVAGRKRERFANVRDPPQHFRRGVVFVNEGVAGGREVIADRRVILAVHREAIAPSRPRFARVVLAWIVHHLHGRRGLGDRDIAGKTRRCSQKCCPFENGHFFSVGQLRWKDWFRGARDECAESDDEDG